MLPLIIHSFISDCKWLLCFCCQWPSRTVDGHHESCLHWRNGRHTSIRAHFQYCLRSLRWSDMPVDLLAQSHAKAGAPRGNKAPATGPVRESCQGYTQEPVAVLAYPVGGPLDVWGRCSMPKLDSSVRGSVPNRRAATCCWAKSCASGTSGSALRVP